MRCSCSVTGHDCAGLDEQTVPLKHHTDPSMQTSSHSHYSMGRRTNGINTNPPPPKRAFVWVSCHNNTTPSLPPHPVVSTPPSIHPPLPVVSSFRLVPSCRPHNCRSPAIRCKVSLSPSLFLIGLIGLFMRRRPLTILFGIVKKRLLGISIVFFG